MSKSISAMLKVPDRVKAQDLEYTMLSGASEIFNSTWGIEGKDGKQVWLLEIMHKSGIES